MKTVPITRYRFFQKLQPVNLLTKISNQSFSGCLQVFSASGTWSIYMDKGKLIYGGYSEKMFEPLYRNLQILSQSISTIPQGINHKLRIIFEQNSKNYSIANPEYLAICWLVNQKYISELPAAILIEQLAIETLQSLLKLEYGSYELIPDSFLDNLPKFCYLDLQYLLDCCHGHVKFNVEEKYNYYSYDDDHYDDHNYRKNEDQKESFIAFDEKNKLPSESVVNDHNDQEKNDNSSFNYQHNYENKYQKSGKKKYCIFCVDENLQILDNIQDFLDDQIFALVKFTSSSQALMEILNVKPDMILLNITMSNLDGYDVCSLLRKNPNYRDIPVILMTERMGLRNRAKAKLVKANSYLEKPFTQGDLLKKIFKHIV